MMHHVMGADELFSIPGSTPTNSFEEFIYSHTWYGMAWHGMAWHGMAWYGNVLPLITSILLLMSCSSTVHIMCNGERRRISKDSVANQLHSCSRKQR